MRRDVVTLWKRLYGMVWFSFALLLISLISPRWLGRRAAFVQLALAVVFLALAKLNDKKLSPLLVPRRARRISRATISASVMLVAFAALCWALGFIQGLPEWALGVAASFQTVMGLAALAHSSSLATAYDMWEEKEIGLTLTAGDSDAQKPAA